MRRWRFGSGALFLLWAFAFQGHGAVVVFDNIPQSGQTGYDSSYYSHGFEAQNTSELGNVVNLAGTARKLDTVTVTMVTSAKSVDYADLYATNNAGWNHSLMLTVWNSTATQILATKTLTTLVPWATPQSGYTSSAFNVSFNFASENITLPNTVLVSLAYNTQNDGYTPLGSPGPYNSLNYGTFDYAPIVGMDAKPGEVMRVFSSDTNTIVFETAPGWDNRAPMMEITATEASPASSYAGDFGLTGPDADPDADPDKDGFSNRMEYAFGLNPASSSGQAKPLEVFTQKTGSGTNAVTTANATFLQRSGVTYTVRATTVLTNGFPTTVTPTVSTNQTGVPPGYTRYEASYNPGTNRGFIKVDATVP